MLVTKIQAVTKQKYRIELDGQPAFVIYKGELSRYGIKEGQEIPGPVYQELVGQVLTKRAKLRAMHLLYESVRETGGTVVVPSSFSEGFGDVLPEGVRYPG